MNILGFMIIRNRIIFKMGFRNILRRKGYTLIVILGLMIGTGVISASLIIGDTMDTMIESEILEYYYTTDEIIYGLKPTGEADYFNESIFLEVENGFSSKYIDGLSPAIQDSVAVLDLVTNLSEPMVGFIGVDFDYAENFGAFINQRDEKVTKLADDEIMIGEDTADELDAKVGHRIIVYANSTPYFFDITYILQSEERAGGADGIFVNLNKAQLMLKKHGKINQILVSNKGGVYEGMEYTENVKEEFGKIKISDELEYKMVVIKKDVLEDSKEGLQQFTDLFMVFGTFSIIAGVILIINIFVMLSEERKSEMGMARAIGMKRKHLKRMYLSEGVIYALIASLVGVFFGIGIGFLIIFALEEIFKSYGAVNILQYFTFTNSSMLIGFVSGFLITIFTIYFTSSRISKLNIVRAIRDIPEPEVSRSDRRMMIIGILIFIFGLLLLISGIISEMFASYLSGISLMIFGFGIIIRRWIGDRIAFNLVGLVILILWILPSDFYPEYKGEIEMFIVSGLFLVFAAMLIVMFNSEYIIKGLTFIIGRGKSRQAVLKTAIKYSLKSKFRTAMTIAIFALIIFTITTMSMIVGMLGTNIERQVEKASGGYEILAFCNLHSPIDDIEKELNDTELYQKIEKIAAPVSGIVGLNITATYGDTAYYRILGVNDRFIEENEFEFSKLLSEYKSGSDAWDAIRENRSLVLLDASILGNDYGPPTAFFQVDIGETIELKDKDNNTVKKKIIGIIDTTFIQGIISYEDYVKEEFGFTSSTYFLFSVNKGENVDYTAKEIERTFLKNGMQAFAIRTLVLESIKAMNQFFNLFNAFMGLGLIIGIAGLGIITIRSVHERRQEIGMMRAIGFKRRMVLSSFLIETSFISLLGIIIGTLLGIFTGYILWRDEFKELGFDFIINWQPIIIVFLIAFIFTLLCIIPASRKASKIPPAEALRYKG